MKMNVGAANQAIDFTKKSKEKKPRGMLGQMSGAAENIASQISSGNPRSPLQQPSIMNRMNQATNAMFGGRNNRPEFNQLRNSLNTQPRQTLMQRQQQMQLGAGLSKSIENTNQVQPQQSEPQQPEMQQASVEQQAAPTQDNSSIDQQIAALQAQIQQLQSQKK